MMPVPITTTHTTEPDPHEERDRRMNVILDAIWEHAMEAIVSNIPSAAQALMAEEDIHAAAHSLAGRFDEADLTVIAVQFAPVSAAAGTAAADEAPPAASVEQATAKALAGIQARIRWASLHWGVEDVHPDAWPHIARAAAEALQEG